MRLLRRTLRFDNANEFVYVFNHIPKSGGTAVRYVLSQWHTIVSDYRKSTTKGETRRHIDSKLDIERIRRPAFVCGHYGLDGAYLHERYPEMFSNDRYRLIVFVRDPLEAAISGFFYAKQAGQNVLSSDISTYLSHYRCNLAKILNCEDGNYDRALRAYWFVGITDRLPESVELLRSKLNKRYIEPPTLNITVRPESPSLESIAKFKRSNQLDFEIYAAACARFYHDFKRSKA